MPSTVWRRSSSKNACADPEPGHEAVFHVREDGILVLGRERHESIVQCRPRVAVERLEPFLVRATVLPVVAVERPRDVARHLRLGCARAVFVGGDQPRDDGFEHGQAGGAEPAVALAGGHSDRSGAENGKSR